MYLSSSRTELLVRLLTNRLVSYPAPTMMVPNHNYWQVYHRTNSLANALSAKWNIGLYFMLNTWGIEHRILSTPGQVKATLVCR